MREIQVFYPTVADHCDIRGSTTSLFVKLRRAVSAAEAEFRGVDIPHSDVTECHSPGNEVRSEIV